MRLKSRGIPFKSVAQGLVAPDVALGQSLFFADQDQMLYAPGSIGGWCSALSAQSVPLLAELVPALAAHFSFAQLVNYFAHTRKNPALCEAQGIWGWKDRLGGADFGQDRGEVSDDIQDLALCQI